MLYDDSWREMPCELWPGPFFKSGGYGKTSKGERAHVLTYRECFGEIAPGRIVMHKCDAPACRQPLHLLAGTKADNTRDMMAKGRGKRPNANRTHCKHGHPLSGENLYAYKNRRICKECARNRVRTARLMQASRATLEQRAAPKPTPDLSPLTPTAR